MWEKCRDVVEGEEKVKAKGEKYLPRPEGMETGEYNKYNQRSEFFNATGRTVDGLHGQMFRKDVIVKVPESMRQYLLNVDGKGHTFEQFVSECSYQSLITHWGGVLIDAPFVEGSISKEKAIQKGIYPFMSYTCAENLYNWHYDDVSRVKTLTRVCIHQKKEYPTVDPFTYETKDEYKLLYLDADNNYKQEVKVDGMTTMEIYPRRKGETMHEIPFFPIPNTDPEKPIILDLVNLNLAWYRKSADLENGGHWTGVPTPYILGYEPETKYNDKGEELPAEPIYLGGSSILCMPTGTQIGYLEYAGSGLSQLRQMLQDDEDRMAILGARIISAEKKGVEAVETARIHRAGENSVLGAFANNLSFVFTKVLKTYLEWITETDINEDEIEVKINTDYDVSRMSSTDLQSVVSAWQSGLITKKVAFDNLQEGEIIPSDLSFEDSEKELQLEKEQQLQQQLEQQALIQQSQVVNQNEV